jgi:hypothetical protein
LDKGYKFLQTETDEDIVFFLEALAGCLKGSASVTPLDVKSFVMNNERLLLAVQRFNHKLLSRQHFVDTLAAVRLRGVRLGTTINKIDGTFEPHRGDFGKPLKYFASVYHVAEKVCEYGIAKYNLDSVINELKEAEHACYLNHRAMEKLEYRIRFMSKHQGDVKNDPDTKELALKLNEKLVHAQT